MFVTADLKAVTYEPLPNRPEARGFYYYLDIADYPHFLQSDMPYQVLRGYIVADSVIRHMPLLTHLYNPIAELNLLSDTVAYIYKHWYYLNEYDPLRFNAFLRKNYSATNNLPTTLYSQLRKKAEDVDPRFVYAFSNYILHLYVNNTVWIDTANTKHPEGFSETVAYCKVLDTLKGGIFPSLGNAIFWNGALQDNISDENIVGNTIPQQTDIVFSYIDQWRRWQPYGPMLIKHTKPFPEHWVKHKKEDITRMIKNITEAINKSSLQQDT
jgi:hypothetical protein